MKTTILAVLVALATVPSQAASAPPKPKLVVVIAIDQFRSDYLTRFEHLFLPATKDGKVGGFKYLMDKGAYFVNAQLQHAGSFTGPGHATMLTGATPYLHGIVSNYWYNFELNSPFYCAEDRDALIINSNTPPQPSDDPKVRAKGRSAKNQLVSTVGDEMKNLSGGRAILASVALKDRSAIFMGGHRADLVLWHDKTNWVSSSYYLPKKVLPGWVVTWNKTNYFEKKKVPAQWTKLLPDSAYELSSAIPPEFLSVPRGTKDAAGFGKTFPHTIDPGGSDLAMTPWGSAYTLDTALEIVKNMKLGADSVTDLLTVSLSSHDIAGHIFGAMSEELQDFTLREDRFLSDFFNSLDKLVPGGLANITIVLTADHGVGTMLPAQARQMGYPGDYIWTGDWKNEANTAVREKFGLSASEQPVLHVTDANVALDHKLLKNKKLDVREVARFVATWLMQKPSILAAYAKADLLEGRIPPTPTARKMAVTTHTQNTGDVMYATRPGHFELDDHTIEGAQHENPTVQDASIPLIFLGAGFRAGRFYEEVALNDLAPTLSAILGIIPPSGSEGHTLAKAIRASAP